MSGDIVQIREFHLRVERKTFENVDEIDKSSAPLERSTH